LQQIFDVKGCHSYCAHHLLPCLKTIQFSEVTELALISIRKYRHMGQRLTADDCKFWSFW
jgi:hypothetical protein